jgi:hypothetical protein
MSDPFASILEQPFFKAIEVAKLLGVSMNSVLGWTEGDPPALASVRTEPRFENSDGELGPGVLRVPREELIHFLVGRSNLPLRTGRPPKERS